MSYYKGLFERRRIKEEDDLDLGDYNYTKMDLAEIIDDIMQYQVNIGEQPASWVRDEDIWERAKEIADESDVDDYWAFVTYIYKKLGGRIG